ncbi:Purine-binding protein precursor [Tritonibacter multivorans]|uniref:Purine-binding protein n=1 Tax=Tritonibacter multivorans TaxID=928856 RepID=A0A0P1G7Q1_9RHOB|nr:BMP family protein [Tritonibacter multivorans]MDA7421137.1 BMP family protein [Tritonibacter multivorans]CUH77656.1 Purine-binding protein precursor [Tritonibacter multivorans]SFD35199.1 basic membrane protein A [Tritonibacter multivorans]
MSYVNTSKIVLSTAAVLMLGTASLAQAETTVALVLPGSIADGGWNAGAYQGLQALKADGFDIAFSENVSQADIPAVVQGYADDGYDLVIGHGYQFGSLFAEISEEYPEQAFFATTSAPGNTEIPSNALYVEFRYTDAAYGMGALAALMSDGKAVGVVGGGDNPTTQGMAKAFVEAAEATKPGLKGYAIVTGDYNDAAKGREAASTMIGNGADVIWHTADITGIGAIEGASSQGAQVIGMFADQTELAPSAMGTSLSANNAGLVQEVAKMVADGSFEGGGMWEPALGFSWLPVYGDASYNTDLISDDVWAQFLDIWSKVDSGEIEPAS